MGVCTLIKKMTLVKYLGAFFEHSLIAPIRAQTSDVKRRTLKTREFFFFFEHKNVKFGRKSLDGLTYKRCLYGNQ